MDNVMDAIKEVKNCAESPITVELAVERYEELLNYEFMYKELTK